MSEAKPLRWSFLVTFSIAVCAIWAVVWTLACSEHARIVDELSRQVAHAPEPVATQALRRMAQLREPPLEAMVVAATSPAREVALQAQDSISDLLRKWQHESTSSRGAARVAIRLERLATALSADQAGFAALDHRWLEGTAERMLRVAIAASPDQTLSFTEQCESLLLVAREQHTAPQLEVVPVATAMLKSTPLALFAPPTRVALQSIVSPDDPSVLDESDAPPEAPEFFTEAAPMPRPLRQGADESLREAEPIPAETPRDDVLADPWAVTSSRALLEQWLTLSSPLKRQIETELRRRGFGRLRSDIVRLALSTENRTARIQLVHDLPAIPGIGAKAWLMLLADDPDAEVRLTAVTVMSTSSDVELLDRAWNVAIHDRDPRIAELAGRLRDRRAATRQH